MWKGRYRAPFGGNGAKWKGDIVACFMGVFIGIECKAGKNKPTDLQKKNLDAISKAGDISLVINEDNLSDVIDVLDDIKEGAKT